LPPRLQGRRSPTARLSEVSLITKDAFEPTLPLSVVVHIDYKKAPLVVQRFGDIKPERGKVDIVPKVMVGGSGGDGKDGMSNNVFSALMAMMLASRSGVGDGLATKPTEPTQGDLKLASP
jgi:hypothetical protein